MTRRQLLQAASLVLAVALGVALSTVMVEILETSLGVRDASSLYLVVVAATAIVFGIRGAVLTAIASVLVYDFLFTEPRYTLTVSDAGEWLNLLLLLFVAVTVGQLAALQRSRAESSSLRERESRTLFEVTRALVARESTLAALPAIAVALARETQMERVWFALGGANDGVERIVGQSATDNTSLEPRAYAVLHRASPGSQYRWTAVRGPVYARANGRGAERHFRVRMEDSGRAVGSIWSTRRRSDGEPNASQTRLLRVAADLIAQALAHDRLADETRRAEIAQQSDALKSALLESVSHDLRTPLASIRAYAGTLKDPDVPLSADDARASADAIDREAQRLNRLVSNLLDLSRIEGGALRVATNALDVEDVVSRAVAQVEPRVGHRPVEVRVAQGTTVKADPVLLEEALVNLLDNAVRHTPDGSIVRVTAAPAEGEGEGFVCLTVEDSGPGVPAEALPSIFEKFSRAGARRPPGGSGTGIGLAVVRGFVEAMGGGVVAHRGELGGLAIDVRLPTASVPTSVRAAR